MVAKFLPIRMGSALVSIEDFTSNNIKPLTKLCHHLVRDLGMVCAGTGELWLVFLINDDNYYYYVKLFLIFIVFPPIVSYHAG